MFEAMSTYASFDFPFSYSVRDDRLKLEVNYDEKNMKRLSPEHNRKSRKNSFRKRFKEEYFFAFP